MSTSSKITLLNLSEHIKAFALDDDIKKNLCFGETLILSCGHHDGDIEEVSEASDWTCYESTSSKTPSKETVENEPPPPQPLLIEDSVVEEEEEPPDFQFFFFPDCKKPLPPQDSKDSIVMVDGLPKMNIIVKVDDLCHCEKDAKGNCECFIKIPCHCGAKTKAECTCHKREEICICRPLEPCPECVCPAEAEVCTCRPGILLPECTCDKIDIPCICRHRTFTFPSVVCECKGKPGSTPSSVSSYPSYYEGDNDGKEIEEKPRQPCECQKPDPKKLCLCVKGKKCTCKTIECICGVQHTCVCIPEEDNEIPCKDEPIENKSICSCEKPAICTCGGKSNECKCFPVKICTCGNPADCKCYSICDCELVCVCDTKAETTKACTCVDSSKVPVTDLICTCPKKEDNKIRKVRAGKHGYRWCHEVDPHHTFFDYAYDRYDKIERKESVVEKVVIQGLGNDLTQEEVCPIHEIKAPKYEKKVRRPSLDCCSAVGGMSICVEALGEDKDKLLVQVVMHSSREGAKTFTKLVSILDCNLHTMEENRTEHITKNNLSKERRNYMAITENGYYNKITRICGEKYVVKRIYHTFEQAHNFLLEGSNIVLLRYMAITRYRGKLKTDTVVMDGLICECVYVSHGVSQALVNSTALFVVKIERHIIEPSGYVHQTLTVLSLRGHIVSHEWADSCYVLHINPLLKVIPEKDEIEEHAPLREKWREDLQLLSDYLDFKTIRTSEGGRYMTESGALTGVVRDYLQAILLLRPQDTMRFTRHYFGSVLSALDLPHDEYFDPASRHVRYYFFEE